jgi:hypothetical protein
VPARARCAAAAVVATVLVAVSGCGSEQHDVKLGDDAKASSTPSASPSASASPQAAPPVPRAGANSRARRIAMAQWFVHAYNYAYATNDPEPLNAVASAQYGCGECSRLTTYLQDQEKAGLHLDPAALTVGRTFETARARSNVWIVDIESRAPRRFDVDASGKHVHTYPAEKSFPIEVGISWEDQQYRITGWKAGEKKS